MYAVWDTETQETIKYFKTVQEAYKFLESIIHASNFERLAVMYMD